jgi:hypothetical protein
MVKFIRLMPGAKTNLHRYAFVQMLALAEYGLSERMRRIDATGI